ncbi:MAG TPA: biotin--[acetyl-CoA-carboxylase] ligase [Methylomirabilota bacterium]|nr:biotin--[acetyl-CoA-carboxylase] ligase [Methylomirabilota bacterium]
MTSVSRSQMPLTERFSMQVIHRDLDARIVGQHIHIFDEVESTNAMLRDLARLGASDGTVVLAESQRRGRGRLGRPWFSPPNVNFYASVLLEGELRLEDMGPVSFIGSLATSDAIKDLGLAPAIKWPNDVLLDRQKVAGALLEWVPRELVPDCAVIGVGVNLNVDLARLREALGPEAAFATSVAAALGRPIDRSRFAASFLNHLDRWWRRYRLAGARPLVRAWQDRDILTGRRVELRGAGGSIEGRALGIDDGGRLIVRTAAGDRHMVLTEDVRVLD